MKRGNAKTPSKGSSYYVYVVSFIAAAGGFNWGYDIILMSGAILYLKNAFNIDSLSVQVSSINVELVLDRRVHDDQRHLWNPHWHAGGRKYR